MKSVRLVSGVRISCCVLILQGWLTSRAFSEEQSVQKLPESSAVSASTWQEELASDVEKTPESNAVSASVKPEGPASKIYFEQTTSDFGQIAPGSSNTGLFKFCNKGDGVLEINNVGATCGCTVPDLEKKKYEPGECGEIKVTYNADRSAGPRTKHLSVNSNDPLSPKIELTIKAFIAEKVVTEPDKLDFMLKGKDAGHITLTVKSLDGKPFSITKFESTGDIVTADFNANENAPQIVLKTAVDVAKAGSTVNGRIEIGLTHPETPLVSIPFTILPRFRTEPPAINIVNAEAGKAVQKELWLLSNYDEDFDITSADSRQGYIKVLSKEKLDKRYKFELEISPPEVKSVARMFTDTLSVSTKDGEKIDIACRGFYQRKHN